MFVSGCKFNFFPIQKDFEILEFWNFEYCILMSKADESEFLNEFLVFPEQQIAIFPSTMLSGFFTISEE